MMKFSSISNIGKVREINEDSYDNISIENYDFFIVADGMGGHSDGELASSLACKAFTNFIKNEKISSYSDVIEFQEEAILSANDQVFELASEKSEKMGTTIVCTCIDYQNNSYLFSHIGDSRIYLFRDDEFSQITKDHSLLNELLDRGAIKEEEIEDFANKSAVTRAVGVGEIVHADHKSIDVKNGDVILMVTDGLTNEVTDEDIAQIIKDNQDVFDISSNLIEAALNSGGKDNITVTTIKM